MVRTGLQGHTVPAMHPGKRSSRALCQSLSLIQLPSWLFTPAAGTGMVSLWFLVTITVLLSTRATSFGSVRASQLQAQQELGARADGKEGGELLVPVLIFGKLLHHPFPLQTCQDIGCFLRRPRHHVHVGGLTFVHRSLYEVRHHRRQRGDGGQGTDADTCPEAAVSERGRESGV